MTHTTEDVIRPVPLPGSPQVVRLFRDKKGWACFQLEVIHPEPAKGEDFYQPPIPSMVLLWVLGVPGKTYFSGILDRLPEERCSLNPEPYWSRLDGSALTDDDSELAMVPLSFGDYPLTADEAIALGGYLVVKKITVSPLESLRRSRSTRKFFP